MRSNWKYLVAVALLAVLAIVFGFAGTSAPISEVVSSQQASAADSVTHFINPPTYDSGWVDIRDQPGKSFGLRHGLNTTQVFVDVRGKRRLNVTAGEPVWKRAYGGVDYDYALSMVQTGDLGYALAGYTESYGAGGQDFWLVKTDAAGAVLWNQTYGGANDERACSVIQTSDGGYALVGYTNSFGAGGYDCWLVKTDATGAALWSQTYGERLNDYARSVVQTGEGGYALAGYTNSYGAGAYDCWLVKTDATGVTQWSQTYGGANNDYARSLIQTGDGGYALAGRTASFGAGSQDFWLVKTDATGVEEWTQTYGGANNDEAESLVQTSDGGYALAGYTESYGAGGQDFWLVKTDATGVTQWNETYGGVGSDHAYSVVETSGREYALVGYTDSFGALFVYDSWLVKTDATGVALWNQTYGGANNDYARSMIQTSDGDYTLVGYTASFGVDLYDFWLVKVNGEVGLEHQWNLGGTFFTPGSSALISVAEADYVYSMVQTADGGYALAGCVGILGDLLLVKTDATGTVQWTQTYGDPLWTMEDTAWSVVQTVDLGYALAGHTESYGASGRDFWLIKTDATGTALWNQTYGGANDDYAHSVVQTRDGGYALAGPTESYGAGDRDFWLVKTDATGALLWTQTYGGAGSDYAHCLVQTSDEGYAVAGYTESYGAGDRDFWLVKTDATGALLWTQTYGGANNDEAESLVQTSDGGYALAGYTESYGAGDRDFWLVKTDAAGVEEWTQTYGGANNEDAYSAVQTGDSGYALVGHTMSFGAGSHDFWLVKTDAAGAAQWSQTYGGAAWDWAFSVVETRDGGYALAGYTNSFGEAGYDLWLITSDVESGLAITGISNRDIILYRAKADPYWNFVRVRIWLIEEPTWQFGDINQDGVVDLQDLAIVGQNYGKTFSLLSLSGIVAVAGIHQYKKRKQPA